MKNKNDMDVFPVRDPKTGRLFCKCEPSRDGYLLISPTCSIPLRYVVESIHIHYGERKKNLLNYNHSVPVRKQRG